MTATRLRTLLLPFAAALLLAGCGSAAALDRAPDATGTLTPLVDERPAHDPALSARYRLEIDPGVDAYYSDAVITVDDTTRIVDSAGTTLRSDALTPGIWVRVWVEPCAESYPVQCTAAEIQLQLVDANALDRAPDAVGTVASAVEGVDGVVIALDADPGYEEYDRATVDIGWWTGADAEAGIAPSVRVEVGDRVALWMGMCRGSLPPLCDAERATFVAD